MSLYTSPLIALPVPNATVWVRIYGNAAPPVQAVYTTSPNIFTTVLTGLVIPAYAVMDWKP